MITFTAAHFSFVSFVFSPLHYRLQLLHPSPPAAPPKGEITLLLYEAQSAFECSLRMPVGL